MTIGKLNDSVFRAVHGTVQLGVYVTFCVLKYATGASLAYGCELNRYCNIKNKEENIFSTPKCLLYDCW